MMSSWIHLINENYLDPNTRWKMQSKSISTNKKSMNISVKLIFSFQIVCFNIAAALNYSRATTELLLRLSLQDLGYS